MARFSRVLENVARLTRQHQLLQNGHNFSPCVIQSRHCAAYEGIGKTHFTQVNKETDLIIIDAFSNLGFRLNNSMKCMGPIVVFPNIILSWNVENLRDIDENSLNIFTLVDPKPELVMVGYGMRFDYENATMMQKKGFKQAMTDIGKVVLAMKKKGISIEMLPTEDAIANYNYLCSENRLVGAALIPPSVIHPLRQSEYAFLGDTLPAEMVREDSFIAIGMELANEPGKPQDDIRGYHAAARRKQRRRPPTDKTKKLT